MLANCSGLMPRPIVGSLARAGREPGPTRTGNRCAGSCAGRTGCASRAPDARHSAAEPVAWALHPLQCERSANMSEEERAGGYRIVVGLDFSELGTRTVLEAIDLARSRSDVDLHVVVVGTGTPEWITLPGDHEAMAEAEAREECRKRVAALIDRFAAERGAVPLER